MNINDFAENNVFFIKCKFPHIVKNMIEVIDEDELYQVSDHMSALNFIADDYYKTDLNIISVANKTELNSCFSLIDYDIPNHKIILVSEHDLEDEILLNSIKVIEFEYDEKEAIKIIVEYMIELINLYNSEALEDDIVDISQFIEDKDVIAELFVGRNQNDILDTIQALYNKTVSINHVTVHQELERR